MTVGKFTYDGQSVAGPAQYMNEKGNDLITKITSGNDTIFNMTCHMSPNLETAVLVRLQTDYAGWLGMQQTFASLRI
jgi:hypothetical protein